MSGRSPLVGRRGRRRGRRTPARAATAALAVLALAAGLSGCWFQEGADGGHTRFNPAERGITPANVDTLAVAWSSPVPDVLGEAVVTSGRVVARSHEGGRSAVITGLDVATGDVVWDTTLITTAGAGAFAAAAPLGMIRDRLATGYFAVSSGPGGGQGCAAAAGFFDPVTGAGSGWQPGRYPAGLAVAGDLVAQAVLVLGPSPCTEPQFELQVTGAYEGEAVQWRHALPGGPPGGGQPIAAGDRVVVPHQGTLRAFAAGGCGGPTDCPALWSAPYAGDPSATATGPIWVPNGSSVVGLDRDTGAVDATLTLDGTAEGIAVAGSRVYAASRATSAGTVDLRAFSASCAASCTPTWRATISGTAVSKPVAGGGMVYIAVTGGSGAQVLGFDAAGCGAATCDPIASVPVPAGGALSLSDGRLFVTGSGTVTALAPTSPPSGSGN